MNHATACEAHEKGDPLTVLEPHLHPTLSDILAALQLLLTPIILHIASLFLSFFAAIYKNFALVRSSVTDGSSLSFFLKYLQLLLKMSVENFKSLTVGKMNFVSTKNLSKECTSIHSYL